MRNLRYIITRVLCAIAVALTFWLLDTYCIDALQNVGPYAGLTISESGSFYDNSSNTAFTNKGYQVGTTAIHYDMDFYYALPTSNLTLTHNGFGGSLSQCGLSFIQGQYYSMTFVFKSLDGSHFIHPFYTKKTNLVGISDVASGQTTFTYDSVSAGVEKLDETYYGGTDGVYTIIFKAPQTGTCITTSFSSSPTGYLNNVPNDLMFLGYKWQSLGSSQLSASDIQNTLSSSFNSINNKIDQSINMITGSVLGSITDNTNSINSNIDELKEKQEEAHETSKGIWGTLKSLVSSIGNWFTDLMSSIGDGFKNLIEGIKALFVGEEVEECKVIKNNFTTYTHWIDDTSLSVPNYYARPVDSDGYIQLYYNSNLYRISDNFGPIKPNTEYTLYVESSPSNSLGSFIFYPSKYNTSNSKNKYRFPSMNTNKTLAPGESAIFYITSNSEDDVNYSLSSMFAYTDYDKQQGGALYARIMLLEGHYTESEIKEKGYFKTEKEICEITNKGGLFGIIKNLGSTIGKWFSDLFGLFKDDDVSDVTNSSSDYFTNFDDKDYGFSDIVKMPLALINNISSASCSTLVLPLPFVDKNVELPCMYDIYSTYFGSFLTLYQTITFGIVAYWVCINLFRMVRNFKNPDSDEVEVFEL